MAARRNASAASAIAFNVTDRFGGQTLSYRAGVAPRGQGAGNRTGCGAYWPDYGSSTMDFSFQEGCNPTKTIFDRNVAPHSAAGLFEHPASPTKTLTATRAHNLHEAREREQFQQFRHPAPHTEALWASTHVQPYKSGGQRKADSMVYRAALGSVKKAPLWCRTFDDPGFQKHDVKPSIGEACQTLGIAAGGVASTNPRHTITKTAMARSESAPNILGGLQGTLGSLETLGAMTVGQTMRRNASMATMTLGGAGGEVATPSWVASRTMATRDPDAAGLAGGKVKKLMAAHATLHAPSRPFSDISGPPSVLPSSRAESVSRG